MYAQLLMEGVFERRQLHGSTRLALADAEHVHGDKPPHLTNSFRPINKADLIAAHNSRFTQNN